MVLPDLFEQHRASDKPALRAHEELEQPEFARLKVDRLSAPAHGAGDEVHFEIAGLEQGLRTSQSRTAGKRGQARHQLLESEGLDDNARKAFADLMRRITGLVQDALSEGTARGEFKGTSRSAALHIVTVTRGLAVLERAYGDEAELRRIAKHTIGLVLGE